MNLLMDALEKAQEARPAEDGSRGGEPIDRTAPRGRPFEPARTTEDEIGAAVPVDEPEDAMHAPLSRPVPRISMPAGPIRAPTDGGDTAGRGDGRPPSMRAGARPEVRRTLDARGMPRRRGTGRIVGAALSLLAVTAGATGGHHFWKTELARPSLVRPLLPASVAAAAPSWTADAVTSVAAEPGADAAAAAGPEGVPASSGAGRTPAPPEVDAGAIPRDGSEAMQPFDTGDVPDSPGSWPDSGHEPRWVAQAGGPTARTTDGSPAGIADPPPRAVRRTRTPPQPDPGSATAPPPNPGTVAAPRPEPDAGGAARPNPGAGIEIRKRKRTDRVAALLERAYGALHSGGAESAAEAYRAVLGHEPRNRDAFLGLAAVAARAGRWDEAAAHYAGILAFDPADSVAQAALIAIDERDPVRGESRLKALLSNEPRAAYLHFGLGNVYAAQSRWPEAQQSYLNAWRLDRGNADYAYNLAVSLDHLSRPERALDFYREALALSEKRPAGFEAAAVHARIRDITAP